MSYQVLEVAINHYKECVGELKRSEAFQNMQKWAKIIVAEGGTVPDPSVIDNDSSPKKSKGVRVPAGSKKKVHPTGKIARIRQLAWDYINQQEGGTAHRGDIQKYISAHDVQVTLKTLSVILSESDEFKPIKGKGWSLS